MDVRPTWDQLDRLDAAAADSANIHNDLCEHPVGGPCSCGIPSLLRELAQVLRVKDAYRLLEAGELGSLAA